MDPHTELVNRHSDICALMGLTPRAIEELNGIVFDLSKLSDADRRRRTDARTSEPEVQRADRPLTREEYLERHRQRFEALRLSQASQGELLGAAEFVWGALHEEDVSPEQREAAETVQKMMLAMGGPPPCCDDSLLERAGRGAPCS